MVKPLFLASLLVGAASAQRGRPTSTRRQDNPGNAQATQTLYGQCGGQTWTGPTSCPNGAYCRNVDDNIWYSQCVPTDAPLPAAGSSGAQAEIRTLTTLISVDGPFPTVISTQITYLQPRPTRTTEPVEIVTVTLVPDEPCQDEFYC